jgi:aminodeoxychorismate synthase component I
MISRSALPPLPALAGLSPVEAAARLRHLPELAFFDTALAPSREGAGLSLIAARPDLILEGHIDRDWPRFSAELERRREATHADDACPRGMAAGCVGYDGRFRFAFYPETLIYDHAGETWREHGALSRELSTTPALATACEAPAFRASMRAEDFCALVRRAHEYIAAGDIYQVNLAHRFTAEWTGDPFALYERLRDVSPAPQAAFLQSGETAILSASPELFLRFSGRLARTRPIKGTRPRFRDPHADEKSAYDLITSPKEIAELVMITDLERNDLGQVCEWGSVCVRELIALERFEQVFHLVSTVEGQLRPDVTQAAAFRACFPGGSITGAPKKRAREIIAELEPEPRGLYTGALGWFGFNGESQFNIAIRTMLIESGRAHFHVGAGIVADSIPEREWEETLAKASGLLSAR